MPTIDDEVVSEQSTLFETPFQPLSEAELAQKQELESIVSSAVWSAGRALRELRDKKLYRDTHQSFALYCQETFGHSRQKSDYLIMAATIKENLEAGGCEVLPKSEFQIRPLGVLEKPSLQVKAWDKAVAIANGRVPRHHIVKKVVRGMTREDADNH